MGSIGLHLQSFQYGKRRLSVITMQGKTMAAMNAAAEQRCTRIARGSNCFVIESRKIVHLKNDFPIAFTISLTGLTSNRPSSRFSSNGCPTMHETNDPMQRLFQNIIKSPIVYQVLLENLWTSATVIPVEVVHPSLKSHRTVPPDKSGARCASMKIPAILRVLQDF